MCFFFTLKCSPILFVALCTVANIAFETTEEQLRAVLSEVGPVVNLKYVIKVMYVLLNKCVCVKPHYCLL